MAAVAVVVTGLSIASAAIPPTSVTGDNTAGKPACGCANHAQCGSGCQAMVGTGSCGCGK